MLSSLVAAALDVGSTPLQFKMVDIPFLLALGLPGRSSTQHFNSENERAAHTAKSAMQSTVRPGNISLYGGRNPPCSPACACLVNLILPPDQAGSAESQDGLRYFVSRVGAQSSGPTNAT